jgi:hypothetical protein
MHLGLAPQAKAGRHTVVLPQTLPVLRNVHAKLSEFHVQLSKHDKMSNCLNNVLIPEHLQLRRHSNLACRMPN